MPAMSASLHRQYALFITSGAQLLLLLIGFHIGTREGWLYCLGIMAAVSLLAWISTLRRLRVLSDTPTSKIASAAQGYVEIIGTGRPYGDSPLISKVSHLPCLWYRYRIERKDSYGHWRIEDQGSSEDSFIMEDDSGWCVVDPCGAEVVTTHKDSWHEHEYRYTEWKLLIGGPVYVIGEFKTLGGSSVAINAKKETKNVLHEWKWDMKAMHARFDLNQDGELDMKEWELARRAARREAGKRVAEAHNQPDFHYIGLSPEHRLFLISHLPPEKLTRRFAFWTWANLVMFFGALGGLAWMLNV
jgi:hypothetical protein